MPTYLVRHRNSERLIGIFAVESFAQLIEQAGQANELTALDYAIVGSDAFRDDRKFAPFPANGVASLTNDP